MSYKDDSKIRYGIIYADPPWEYRNKKTGGSMISGAVSKYPTMSVDAICNLPIQQIADRDSALFLWTTVPMLPDALRVMEAWGYKYKTKITWRKIMYWGMGFWFRGQIEDLLVGARGKVKAFRCQRANFIQCKVGNHSQKPEDFRELIEFATRNMTNQNRIELFARVSAPGWDCLGNGIDNKDIREALLEKVKFGSYQSPAPVPAS